MILELKNINVSIKASQILHNININVMEKEVVCLIGRNGAGKTTIMKTIMGFIKPDSGSIKFMGKEIIGLAPYEIALLGIGFAPEESEIFADLTTFENIEIATWTRQTSRTSEERINLAYSVFPSLKKYMTRKGMQISGGERKMLSIGRALAMDPQMLLLDESFEGLSPFIIPQIADSIYEISKMGCSILLAESNIYHVPDYTNRIYVIERGEIIFVGTPEELKNDKKVLRVVAGVS